MRPYHSDGRKPSFASLTSGAIGQRLGDLFQIERAPALVGRQPSLSAMAVTEIRSDDPVLGLIDPVPTEDAYLVSLMLRGLDNHQVWERGQPCKRHSVGVGQFHIRDLKREQAALIEQPHHSLQFYVPRAALVDIAAQAESCAVGELRYEPGVPITDPIVWDLGSCLGSAFRSPEQVNRLFLDHVTMAFGFHIAQTYGELSFASKRRRGGLANWQEKRAKELIDSDLKGKTTLEEVAQQCGLSVSHFSRAFRESTGLAPHRWLIKRRIEVAKDVLRNSRLTLAETALSVGFADQSHFTRIFSRVVGTSPGAWRRSEELPVASNESDKRNVQSVVV